MGSKGVIQGGKEHPSGATIANGDCNVYARCASPVSFVLVMSRVEISKYPVPHFVGILCVLGKKGQKT